jgi:metal-responsive CopG/Arc/MetJ family transcriptional regulator
MPTIKTAISIDEDVYHEIERMTKRLHISRSQFFSQAAGYMITQKENIELLQKINAAYATPGESDEEKRQRKQEKRYHTARLAGQWK